MFAQQGFHQSTVAQIAKEAGVADGTIYLYFKNKNDILVNFFSYKTKLVFDRFRAEVDTAENSLDKLRNLIRRHLTEFQRDRNMAVVYQVETHQNSRLAEERIREMSKMYQDIISEIVILGGVDEVINTWIHSEGKYDLVSMADPLVDLFIRGIGTAATIK